MKVAVAFICSNYNKYSISALAGAIESIPETENTPLYFLAVKKQTKPNWLLQELNSLLKKHEKLLVCFSFATTNIVDVYGLLSTLRGEINGPKVIYIAGGPHTTGDPAGTLALGFDLVFIGEAEESLPELIRSLSMDSDYTKIKGMAYIQNDKLVKTGKRLLIDLNRFAPYSIKHKALSPIEISRGCPHACRFCQTSFIFGGRMRHRSTTEILRYIELGRNSGNRDFRFISPNALAYGSEDGKTVNLEVIEHLLKKASEITGKDHLFFGSFPSEVRPESVSQEAIGLIKEFTATKQLVIGAQTGSQRMLDLLHRQHSVEDIYRAVDLTLRAGLNASVDFIFGLPEETIEDRHLSIEMVDKLAKLGARIHSHTFIPLPGTPLANSKAGTVDKSLARYLSKLANKGLQFGQWEKQQDMAEKAIAFRRNIKI